MDPRLQTPIGPDGAHAPQESRSGRKAERFQVHDYVLTVTKSGGLVPLGKKRNLAVRLVDVSAMGALVESVEELARESKVRFSLHLTKFEDTLHAEGTVVRVFRKRRGDNEVWHAGIKFGPMDPATVRLVNHMASWFTSYQARFRKSR
ncbi:MAG: PilZ domain-containing protein [Planctomycetes bacterium]|nr:PilZ domain-containing protein [Planctomycetota bacterium]